MVKLRYANVSLPISFRPILDAINTPSYKLVKSFVPILSPLSINEYTVKDSLAFPKANIKTDCKYVMAFLPIYL